MANSDNITKADMNNLADAIDEYLNVLTEVMIIPEEIKRDIEDDVKSSMKLVKELVKKLRKGDRSVFKDEDEWNSIF